jgi:hypothetical protein
MATLNASLLQLIDRQTPFSYLYYFPPRFSIISILQLYTYTTSLEASTYSEMPNNQSPTPR